MDLGHLYEKVEKLKVAFRIVILAGTVIVISGLFIWFYYIPTSEEITKTRQQIAGLEQQLAKAKLAATRLAQFEADWGEADTHFKEALKLLPNTKEIPNLLKTITQLGSDSQLEFRLFSPQRERMKDFYVEIPVSIEIRGNYHHIAVFFDKVGAMERIVNILNVSMAPDAARSTNLNAKCDAVTYRFKGESDVPPPKT